VTVPTGFDPVSADRWRYLATTNRGLEPVAAEEIGALTGADATLAYPGVVRFTADEEALFRLARCSRTLHRLLLVLARSSPESLAEIVAAVREVDLPAYLGPEQSFAVRARRRGDHPFGSPDVEAAVGQAIVDEYRRREGTRPPVDLDDPDVLFRVIVREDRATVTIDTTGQRSLHRRWYRRREHEAALRPTIAAAMLRIAGYEPGDRLLDPMCGAGTIPIEAALLATGRSPTPDRESPSSRFRFLDADGAAATLDRAGGDSQPGDCSAGAFSTTPEIVAADRDRSAVAAARENARVADVASQVCFAQADARHPPVDRELVVTDMPYGVRTGGDIHSLYAGFAELLAAGTFERAVVLTAREDLLAPDPARTVPIRRGRLDVSILVFE